MQKEKEIDVIKDVWKFMFVLRLIKQFMFEAERFI